MASSSTTSATTSCRRREPFATLSTSPINTTASFGDGGGNSEHHEQTIITESATSTSLDEGYQRMSEQNKNDPSSGGENKSTSAAVLSLHSSFDGGGTPFQRTQKDSIFRLGGGNNDHHSSVVWDTYAPSNTTGGSKDTSEPDVAELTGRKHLRQQAHQASISLPPGTVRKLPRRSGGSGGGAACLTISTSDEHAPPSSVSKTPGRHYLKASSSSQYHGLPPPTPVSNAAPARRRASSTPGRGSGGSGLSSSSSSSLQRSYSPYRVRSPFRKGLVAAATPRPFSAASLTTTSATSTPSRTTPIMKGGSSSVANTTSNNSSLIMAAALGPAATLTKTRSLQTAATMANTTTTSSALLDATLDSEDAATLSPASSTPFRFTSFPASLPRVQPKTLTTSTTSSAYTSAVAPPTTVRKRMTFSSKVKASAAEGDADTSMAKKPLVGAFLSTSYSRDDEGTQNSSISSVSGEQQQQQQQHQQSQHCQQQHQAAQNANSNSLTQAPSFPPPVLEWKSPDLACSAYSRGGGGVGLSSIDPKYSEDSNDLHESISHHRRPVAIHTKLFSDETIEEIGRGGYGGRGGNDDDDENDVVGSSALHHNDKCDDSSASSPLAVPRTRLNFNMLMKPVDEKEAEKETQTSNSAKDPSGGASSENFSSSNSDGMDCGSVSTAAAMTPSRPSAGGGGMPLMMMMMMNGSSSGSNSSLMHAPPTPDEVQFHFHVDGAQCSPIPGIPEEGENEMELDHHHPVVAPSLPLNSSGNNNDGGRGSLVVGGISNKSDVIPKALDLSQQSSDSSTSSSKLRKLRPMPDMSAFDASGSIKSGGSASRNGGGSDKMASDGDHHQPRLLCPPTPVRTPAWAHNENPFLRANSLIATKVLATCPVSVVDGHSSLENSLMDEDGPVVGNAAAAAAAAAETLQMRRTSLSFSTLPEEAAAVNRRKDEDDDDMSNEILALDSADNNSHGGEGDGIGALPKTPFAGSHSSGSNNHHRWPPPKLLTNKSGEIGSIISFTNNFENLGQLGSGAFADVFKVRSHTDGQLYAVKRNRRQFRGKRDRDLAMTEVRTMQRLQNVVANNATSENNGRVMIGSKTLYLLFFYRAWQEEGYFFCQTELCCRDTCRELMESLKLYWVDASRKYPSLLRHLAPTEESFLSRSAENDEACRLLPEQTWWKICHDICAGLSHIHSQGIVHHDIKPSNIFFVSHARFGAMCKIGDFGMAGDTGTAEDGQEGDTFYMAPELLASSIKHPSADLFSLGLTLYELAASVSWELPVEGPRWHEVRSGSHVPEMHSSRSSELVRLIQCMIRATPERRPTADWLLEQTRVREAGLRHDSFLHDYIHDVEEFDRIREERIAQQQAADVGFTPRGDTTIRELRTPTPGLPHVPVLFTPDAVNK